MHSREYLAEQKCKGGAYLKENDATIAEHKAADDSEYELDAEEEAHVEEEDLGDEEEVALAKSKAMKICQMNKENREAVRQHQKTGSMSYVSYFSKLVRIPNILLVVLCLLHLALMLQFHISCRKKTSTIIRTQVPLSFSKTAIQTARLIACAESGLLAHNAMEKKREAQSEGEQPVSDTAIVAEVLKEESSHSTVLSSMGYASRSGRSGSSTSSS
uniref:Uncharacterized protein n=3 Tax=Aegilops tauschii subsp. strangulata TaxID=200361 RepID=A0A453SNS8_AEGTS